MEEHKDPKSSKSSDVKPAPEALSIRDAIKTDPDMRRFIQILYNTAKRLSEDPELYARLRQLVAEQDARYGRLPEEEDSSPEQLDLFTRG